MSRQTDYQLVCAIDLGSTYTGYAYGDSVSITLNQEWGSQLGLASYKVPTSILTNEDGGFEEFGYDAEYKYTKLCALKEAGKRNLYQKFMLQVAGQKTITRQTLVRSTTRGERPLVELLQITLEHIKLHFKKQIAKDTNKVVDDGCICWVLPVPSCWDDSTIRLITELACQVGLIRDVTSKQLMCVPGSKMAAVYCRMLDQDRFKGSAKNTGITFNAGTKFMVIDAGGCLKMSTHEVLASGDVIEVDAPMTDLCGGQAINQQFEELLQRVLGEEFIQRYKEHNPDFWYQQVDVIFEKRKRSYIINDPDIRLPVKTKLAKEHKLITGDEIDDIVQRFEELGLSSDIDDLVINKKALVQFYEHASHSMMPKIESLLKSQRLRGMKHIFVVGGFGESEVLRQMIASQFTRYSVFTVEDAWTAVLRGAVAYGQSQDNIPIKQPQKFATDSEKDFRLVCAIDFGTTYSGYAYSDSGDIDSVIMNKEWENPLGLSSFKTATSVLTNKEGQCDAFGFMAEYKFSKLCADDDAEGINLFKHFKMLLHNEKELNRDTMVTSTTGTERPAFDLFTLSLAFMKEQFWEAVNEKEGSYPDMNEIRWVITIPAIWSDRAKQFMREAAHQAGLISEVDSKRLLFALEPEAAALYCQDLHLANSMDKFIGTDQSMDEGVDFSEGCKYMVIDAGGGTVDISVQQVLPGGNIKQLISPSGGGWGGNTINSQFEALMTTIFGKEFIQEYKKEFPDDWLELETIFEKQKRSHKADGAAVISLSITSSFDSFHKEFTNKKVKEVVEKFSDTGVSIKKFRLVIDPSKTLEFYQTVTTKIIPYVADLLESVELKDLNHIFLVGGFAESEFLKKAMGAAFFKHVVLTPENAVSAVIRGAVIFGHNPERIASRIARKTYGCSMYVPFNEKVHDPKRKTYDENKEEFCKNGFEKYITKGDEVKIGESKTFISYPFSSNSTAIVKKLVSSDSKDNIYSDEEGVVKIGELRIPMLDTKGGKDRKIETKVFFGGTEITVKSCDARDGGKTVKASLNFLCDPNL